MAILTSDPSVTTLLPDGVTGRAVDPAVADAAALAGVALAVVTDGAGLARVRADGEAAPTVAYVDDPTGDVATADGVDAVATSPDDLTATVEWALERASEIRTAPAQTPSRIERLNAGTTTLASVRSAEEAHRAAITVAEAVFPNHHSLIGVRDGEWVEPVTASSEVPVEDCNRVRVGSGAAGTVVVTGEPVVESNPKPDSPFDTVLSLPVGDDTVFQLVTDDPGGFDESDRRLAGLLASHIEETLDRIRVNEALRTEHDHLLALFSNIPDPAVAYDYVDDDPIVYRVNDAFEATFGYDAETIVGESIDDYVISGETAAVQEVDDINDRLLRGESVRREVTRETAEGTRHFILHVVPVRLDTENGSGYAIYTDVTDQREREATLREQNERLDEFASIVSHDLRNPLSVAEGYVNLAIDTEEPAHLTKVDAALQRMDELVGDLLSLARKGRSVGETESVSIATLARDAWESVETDDADLVVESDVTLDADPTRACELLENVFRNSVEHGSPEPDDVRGDGRSTDRLTVRVGEVSFRSQDADAGFFVEDDGCGLPEEVDRVFESGFTTDEAGTGLGLAITERIAEAHGWEARALTGASGGARFEFRPS